jgi:hypothetical protein
MGIVVSQELRVLGSSSVEREDIEASRSSCSAPVAIDARVCHPAG